MIFDSPSPANFLTIFIILCYTMAITKLNRVIRNFLPLKGFIKMLMTKILKIILVDSGGVGGRGASL